MMVVPQLVSWKKDGYAQQHTLKSLFVVLCVEMVFTYLIMNYVMTIMVWMEMDVISFV